MFTVKNALPLCIFEFRDLLAFQLKLHAETAKLMIEYLSSCLQQNPKSTYLLNIIIMVFTDNLTDYIVFVDLSNNIIILLNNNF